MPRPRKKKSARPKAPKSRIDPNAPKNKGGRPKIELDSDTVRKLAAMNLSRAEIASALGCSEDTLERNYKEPFWQGKHDFTASIKRSQYQVGILGGDSPMLRHLGTHYIPEQRKVISVDADIRFRDVTPESIDFAIDAIFREIEIIESGDVQEEPDALPDSRLLGVTSGGVLRKEAPNQNVGRSGGDRRKRKG